MSITHAVIHTSDYSIDVLSEHFLEGVTRDSTNPVPRDRWQEFVGKIEYQQADILQDKSYETQSKVLRKKEKQWQSTAEKIFYLATPPSLFRPIAQALANSGLASDREHARIVVEKPIGHDLASFQEINQALCSAFQEDQVFRIDHYLGKETVQNILAFRFANPMFEPIWNRRYIDHIAITVA